MRKKAHDRKPVRLKAIRGFAKFLKSKGATQRYDLGEEDTGVYRIDTRFGLADISLSAGSHCWNLFIQFDEPDRAWKGLFGNAPKDWNHGLNPHSGKMNTHAVLAVSAASFIAHSEAEVERITG